MFRFVFHRACQNSLHLARKRRVDLACRGFFVKSKISSGLSCGRSGQQVKHRSRPNCAVSRAWNRWAVCPARAVRQAMRRRHRLFGRGDVYLRPDRDRQKIRASGLDEIPATPDGRRFERVERMVTAFRGNTNRNIDFGSGGGKVVSWGGIFCVCTRGAHLELRSA